MIQQYFHDDQSAARKSRVSSLRSCQLTFAPFSSSRMPCWILFVDDIAIFSFVNIFSWNFSSLTLQIHLQKKFFKEIQKTLKCILFPIRYHLLANLNSKSNVQLTLKDISRLYLNRMASWVAFTCAESSALEFVILWFFDSCQWFCLYTSLEELTNSPLPYDHSPKYFFVETKLNWERLKTRKY